MKLHGYVTALVVCYASHPEDIGPSIIYCHAFAVALRMGLALVPYPKTFIFLELVVVVSGKQAAQNAGKIVTPGLKYISFLCGSAAADY